MEKIIIKKYLDLIQIIFLQMKIQSLLIQIKILQQLELLIKFRYYQKIINLFIQHICLKGQTRILQFEEDIIPFQQEKRKTQKKFSVFGVSLDKIRDSNIFRKLINKIESNQDEQNVILKTKQLFVKEQNIQADSYEKMIFLVLKKISVSVIFKSKNKGNLELCHIYFKDLEFCMFEQLDSRLFQLRIKYLNIDNNADSQTNLPVIFTPSKKDLHDHINQYFFDLCFKFNPHTQDILYFEFFKPQILEAIIRLEEEYIELIIELVLKIRNFLKKTSTYKKTLGQKEFDNFLRILLPHSFNTNQLMKEWLYIEVPAVTKYIYLKELILPPIQVNLTFNHKFGTKSNDVSFNFLQTVGSALGTALSNIDEAPLQLKGLQLRHIFDTQNGIIKKVVDHYQHGLGSGLLRILGSINIIGNPYGLWSNISQGVGDLIDKPREGLVNGPLEAGVAILEGAGSLLKKTISGTCNSINKMTGSMANGLSMLTMDQDYHDQRRRLRFIKAKGIVDGIGQALRSQYFGIQDGIKGLVVYPVKGALNDGVKGFVIGTVKGISGLVVKPVVGFLDFHSKTSEGVKMAATDEQDLPNNERMRLPRTFYDIQRYFKQFKKQDSEILSFLYAYKKNRYQNNHFIDAFIIKNQVSYDDIYQLVLTIEEILLFDMKSKKLVWEIQPNNIKLIEILPDLEDHNLSHIQLYLHEQIQDTKIFRITLNQSIEKSVYDKIEMLREEIVADDQ